jgi:pyruvate dehydrogenase E2 component (dihydrolipoamide acetyltransferase)
MATLLRVPEVAAGAAEAVLSEWLVGENTPYRAGDSIALLETDKAQVEIEAEADAVILRTLVSGGSHVGVGAVIALLGRESEIGADTDRLLAQLGVGAAQADAPTSVRPTRDEQAQGEGARVFISPLARKLVREAGLTTEQVRGTGPNGRIIRRDVERAVQENHAATAPPTAAPDPVGPAPTVRPTTATATAGFSEIPHTRQRRAVAARLTASKQTIPHFYVKRTARVDALLAFRSALNEVSPQKISVNDLVIAAAAAAHQAVPDANVIWTEEGMRQFESVDIAVAIAAQRGLVTPVLRGVERLSPSAIARQVRTYVQRADEGTLQQADLEGGSLTVTNLGMYGVEEFSAIINPPHSAILAVGAAREAPLVVDGAVQVATQMALVLSVDHRAIDGALAARWMQALIQALEQPLRLVA